MRVEAGYTHFSAHESSQTSQIPRRLLKSRKFSKIYSVEYRLLPHGPFPAALQDGVTVLLGLIHQGVDPGKIVLIGDSAGGNLVLALCRWVLEEGVKNGVARVGGLVLLSPWCDPSHAFSHTLSSHIPRPNAPTDYLTDVPSARTLLVYTLLGSNPRSFITSPYISPTAPPSAELSSTSLPLGIVPNGGGGEERREEDEEALDMPEVGRARFEGFPPTFVHYGKYERLESEIEELVSRMRGDGVELKVRKDETPHDVLMLQFWSEKVRGAIGEEIAAWLGGLWEGRREEGREKGKVEGKPKV